MRIMESGSHARHPHPVTPIRRRKLSVVLNRTSGTIQQLGVDVVVDGLREIWENLGYEAEITSTSGDDLTPALESARDGSADAVVVAGGDGTVAAAATLLAGHPKPLGILPLGTFNLAARDVGMPMDWKEAASLVVTAPEAQMDLLAVDDKLFLCIMVMGFYPNLMIGRPDYHGSWIVKTVRTLWDALSSAATFPPLNLRITDGDAIHTHRTRVVLVANNDYEDMFGVLPVRRSLDAGYFTVYISTHQTTWGLVKAMAEWVVGGWKQDRQVIAIRSTEVEVNMTHKRRVPLMIDGEFEKIDLPFIVRMKPKALCVLTPHHAKGAHPPA